MQMFYKALVVDNGGITEERTEGKHNRAVKVRVLGVHPFEGELDYENVPDESLPWAYQACPVGVANSSDSLYNVPKVGQWVWVFFEDEGFQKPVYFAFITSDRDSDGNFTPDKTTVKKDNFDNTTTIQDSEGFTNTSSNQCSFTMSSKDSKVSLSNGESGFILNGEKAQINNISQNDENTKLNDSEKVQNMIYGNVLLNLLQSGTHLLNNSFTGLKDSVKDFSDMNEGGYDAENGNYDLSSMQMLMPIMNISIDAPKLEIDKNTTLIAGGYKDGNNWFYNDEKGKPYPTTEAEVKKAQQDIKDKFSNFQKEMQEFINNNEEAVKDFANILKTIGTNIAKTSTSFMGAVSGFVCPDVPRLAVAVEIQLYNIAVAIYNLNKKVETALENVTNQNEKDEWINEESYTQGYHRYTNLAEINWHNPHILNENAYFCPSNSTLETYEEDNPTENILITKDYSCISDYSGIADNPVDTITNEEADRNIDEILKYGEIGDRFALDCILQTFEHEGGWVGNDAGAGCTYRGVLLYNQPQVFDLILKSLISKYGVPYVPASERGKFSNVRIPSPMELMNNAKLYIPRLTVSAKYNAKEGKYVYYGIDNVKKALSAFKPFVALNTDEDYLKLCWILSEYVPNGYKSQGQYISLINTQIPSCITPKNWKVRGTDEDQKVFNAIVNVYYKNYFVKNSYSVPLAEAQLPSLSYFCYDVSVQHGAGKILQMIQTATGRKYSSNNQALLGLISFANTASESNALQKLVDVRKTYGYCSRSTRAGISAKSLAKLYEDKTITAIV